MAPRRKASRGRASRPAERPTATIPQPVQWFYVRIENLTAQVLNVSVVSDSGATEGLKLLPRGKSRPIQADRVGSYTRDLERAGRVRVIPES